MATYDNLPIYHASYTLLPPPHHELREPVPHWEIVYPHGFEESFRLDPRTVRGYACRDYILLFEPELEPPDIRPDRVIRNGLRVGYVVPLQGNAVGKEIYEEFFRIDHG